MHHSDTATGNLWHLVSVLGATFCHQCHYLKVTAQQLRLKSHHSLRESEVSAKVDQLLFRRTVMSPITNPPASP